MGSPTRIPNPCWVPFLSKRGKREGVGEGEGKRGRRPLLVEFIPAMEGARGHPAALLSFPLKPIKAHYFSRGVPVTSRYFEKCLNLSETFPVSEHNLTIYQSLCLDHFETPRHVHDHIRDSEQPSVHQNL